jgi:hypothetical protein
MKMKMEMSRIAEFEKVSFEQFQEGWVGSFGETPTETIRTAYEKHASSQKGDGRIGRI